MMRAPSEALRNMVEKDGPVRMIKKNLHFAFFSVNGSIIKFGETQYMCARLCAHFHKVGIYLSSMSSMYSLLQSVWSRVLVNFFTWGRGKRGEGF